MLWQNLILVYGKSCSEDCKPERGGGSGGDYYYYSHFSVEETKARVNLPKVIQVVSGRFSFMNLSCLTPYFLLLK